MAHGFGKKDIEIEFAEGLLTVKSVKEKEGKGNFTKVSHRETLLESSLLLTIL